MAIHPVLILPQGLPLRRMLIALGLSLLAHFLMVGGWGDRGAARTAPASVPLQARLEPMPVALPALAAVDTPPAAAAPQPELPVRRAAMARSDAAMTEPSPAGTARGGPDLRFYLARELDQYPAPLTALHPDHGHGTGSARLWVSIDQAGQVVDAALIDAEVPGEFGRWARERVLATRFVPAQRDGRPVKSRVLLVLGQGG